MSIKHILSPVAVIMTGLFKLTGTGAAQETTNTPNAAERSAKPDGREGDRDRKFADGRFRKHGGHRRGMMRGRRAFLGGLELTEAQRAQIRSIRETNRPDRANMEAIRPLIEAKRNGTITAEQQQQLDTFRNNAREKARSVRDQIEAILTPEQKARVEQKRQEMKTRMEEHRRLREERKKDRPTDTTKPVQ